MICSIEAKLLEPLVHFLHLLGAKHVLPGLLINSSNQLGVRIARVCLSSQGIAQNRGQEDS